MTCLRSVSHSGTCTRGLGSWSRCKVPPLLGGQAWALLLGPGGHWGVKPWASGLWGPHGAFLPGSPHFPNFLSFPDVCAEALRSPDLCDILPVHSFLPPG